MKTIYTCVLLLALCCDASGQTDSTRGSIPSTAETAIGKLKFRINYYSPAVRGRIIWGGLVPMGQVWVTGAHSATTIEFSVPVEIGGKEVKAGKYALFTIPGNDEWTIIINKNWEQHLADEYSATDDVARVKATVKETPPRERLNYALKQIDEKNIEVSIAWEKVGVSFPFKLLSDKPKYKLPKAKPAGVGAAPMVHSGSMTHAFSKSLIMNRNGSGTGWLPDQTPMYAWMKTGDSWSTMWHGGLFIRQNWQNVNNDFQNGGRQFDVPGWAMGMAQKEVGDNGLLLLRGMVSIDAITMGGSGYPLLYQTGESYAGAPLVNRQHPHDFFTELGVGYTHRVSTDVDVSVYVGYPGEPAVGPTAFMHRISSMNNPDAPLGHHWQDATHVTFGVATLGFRFRDFKIEGSSFTGREPDEHRYNFDPPKFDSYSTRLSVSPNKSVVMQVSYAFLNSPEEHAPDEDFNRATASVIYSLASSGDKLVTAAAVWGFNQSTTHTEHQEHSVLLESNFQMGRQAVYGRYEWVKKSAEELELTALGEQLIPIQSITIGTNRTLANLFNTDIALGVQGTFSIQPTELDAYYGQHPFSAEIYLRIVPRLMVM